MKEKIKLKRLLTEVIIRKYPIEKPKARGGLIEILFDPSKTKFDVNDYIIRTLKSRRTQRYVLSKAKNVLQYHILGKCVRYRQRGLGSTVKIRNSVSLTVFELNYSIYSRYITHIIIHKNPTKKYKKSTQYYLRKRSAIKSYVEFAFTIEEMKIWAEETTGEKKVSEDIEDRDLIFDQAILYRTFSTSIRMSEQEKVKKHV